MKGIHDRTENVAKAGKSSDAELTELRSRFEDNMLRADQLSKKMLALFVILSAVWILLKLSTTGKISVLGLEITDIPLLLSVIPCLAALSFYQFVCAEGLVELIDSALRSIYKKQLPLSYSENLTELLVVPRIHRIETSLVNMELKRSFFRHLSITWMIVLAFVFFAIPAGVIVWMFVVVVGLNQAPTLVRVISLATTGLLVLRSLTLVIQWARSLNFSLDESILLNRRK
jgi:hypothetical protein